MVHKIKMRMREKKMKRERKKELIFTLKFLNESKLTEVMMLLCKVKSKKLVNFELTNLT